MGMPSDETFDLKAARESVGLSQVELAKRLGVSQSAVSYWEAGLRPITGPAKRLAQHIVAQEQRRISRRKGNQGAESKAGIDARG